MRTIRLYWVFILVAQLGGCDDEWVSPYPAPVGEASVTLVGTSGTETLEVSSPDGDVYLQFWDHQEYCDFWVGVYHPDGDTRLWVRIGADEVPDLVAGEAQDATAYRGLFFVSDSVVRVERPWTDGEVHTWYSAGGRVHIEALPDIGGELRVTFHDVALLHYEGDDERLLNGEVRGTYRGAVLERGWTERGCPGVASLADP